MGGEFVPLFSRISSLGPPNLDFTCASFSSSLIRSLITSHTCQSWLPGHCRFKDFATVDFLEIYKKRRSLLLFSYFRWSLILFSRVQDNNMTSRGPFQATKVPARCCASFIQDRSQRIYELEFRRNNHEQAKRRDELGHSDRQRDVEKGSSLEKSSRLLRLQATNSLRTLRQQCNEFGPFLSRTPLSAGPESTCQ